jgi:hypothetical protein
MQDMSKPLKKQSSAISEHTVSTNHMSNMDGSSGDGSATRAEEPTPNYSSIMYDRWQKANVVSIPQID